MMTILSSIIGAVNNETKSKDLIKESELNTKLRRDQRALPFLPSQQQTLAVAPAIAVERPLAVEPITQSKYIYGKGKSKQVKVNQASFENKIRKIVSNYFGKPFVKVRLPCLRNPITKKNLELDIYNEDLKLGLEFQGHMHYSYIPHFHKSYKDFENQVLRDAIKMRLCHENNIKLVTIAYWEINKDMLDSEILNNVILPKIAKVL